MKATGMVRKIDDLGRIVIPKKGTFEFIKKQGIVGIFSGGLASASAGIAAAVFFGYLAMLISSIKDKSQASN